MKTVASSGTATSSRALSLVACGLALAWFATASRAQQDGARASQRPAFVPAFTSSSAAPGPISLRLRMSRALANAPAVFIVAARDAPNAGDANADANQAGTTQDRASDKGDSAEPGPQPGDATAPASSPPSSAAASVGRALKFGVDVYSGRSNVPGNKRFSDGMWYGYGPFLPSVAYMRWENGRGAAAKLSLGTGALFNTAGDEFYQPAEAWLQLPLGKSGKASVTAGKFWAPFALQEWQLESKPGLMLQWQGRRTSIAAAATHNRTTQRANNYVRVGRSFGDKASLGVSLATGRGLTYNSDHNRGLGLDGTLAFGDWRLFGEYLEFRRNGGGRFHFDWIKLSYEGLGRLNPWVARVKWLDELEQQGRYRALTFGLNYQLTSALAIEGAYADTPDKGLFWLQLHWKQEY